MPGALIRPYLEFVNQNSDRVELIAIILTLHVEWC